MSIIELVRVAFAQLLANKLRSFLTLLGIVIGVWFVISVVSIMDAFSSKMLTSAADLSIDVFEVTPKSQRDMRDIGLKYTSKIELDAADEIMKQCPHVVYAVPEMATYQVQYHYEDKKTSSAYVLRGTTNGYLENKGFSLEKGRHFSASEEYSGRNVIIIGADIATTLYKNREPIGETVHVKGKGYTVIGTIKKKGNTSGGSQDNFALIPIRGFQRNIGDYRVEITVKATSFNELDIAIDETRSVLRKVNKTPPGLDDDFEIVTNESESADIVGILKAVSIIGSVLGFIALLVGGIGVMNIMLASVKERTKEIGIRKSLGAKKNSILFQFLFESTFLSILGCIIGVIIGIVTGFGISLLLEVSPVIPFSAIALAIGVTAFIGIGFGSVPAWKAAKLNPVEALRYE